MAMDATLKAWDELTEIEIGQKLEASEAAIQKGLVYTQEEADARIHEVLRRHTMLADGIPFNTKQDYKSSQVVRAMYGQNELAQQNGTANMTLDEINEEIAATRAYCI